MIIDKFASKNVMLTLCGVGFGILLSAAAVKLGANENHLLITGMVLTFLL